MRIQRSFFNNLILVSLLSTSSNIYPFLFRALPSTTVRQGLVCSGPLLLTIGAYCKGHKTKTGKLAGCALCLLGSAVTSLGWSIARYDGMLNSFLDDVYLTNPLHLAYLSIGTLATVYTTYRLAKLIKKKIKNKDKPPHHNK